MDHPDIDVPVVRERAGGVEIVRLNRPGKRNALDSSTLSTLTSALEQLAADAGIRALVLSTTNLRAFCAGADVDEVLDHGGGLARMSAFTRLYELIESFPVPTIAVCVGNCVGAGAEVVAGCDLRVGGDNLKLSWAGARLGVPVGPARLTPPDRSGAGQGPGIHRPRARRCRGRRIRTAAPHRAGGRVRGRRAPSWQHQWRPTRPAARACSSRCSARSRPPRSGWPTRTSG